MDKHYTVTTGTKSRRRDNKSGEKKALLRCTALLLAVVLLSGILLAASSTRDARILHDLGLFNGTNKGYELNRSINRAEAATMLLRLLGEERTASSEDWRHPFVDLPDWAEQNIGYMFVQGLTNGMTEYRFCPKIPCTLQMYATFVLRALGYSEECGDFTYDEALDLAGALDLIPEGLSGEEDFLRDYAVAVSLRALAAPLKDGSMSLFDKLVECGAISEEAASRHQELSLFAAADSCR